MKHVFRVQTFHSDSEADSIFGEESVGSGWYDLEPTFRTFQDAELKRDELRNDGFYVRITRDNDPIP